MVATLGGTLLTFSFKNQRTLTLGSTESDYVALSACAQEVNFVGMLLGEMTEVENPSVFYEDNQSAIFLAKNGQVRIRTNHVGIRHHFLRDVVEENDIDIQYIRSEYNPADIITNNTSEAYFSRHTKTITNRELWELMETGRDNVNNIGVMCGVTYCDLN